MRKVFSTSLLISALLCGCVQPRTKSEFTSVSTDSRPLVAPGALNAERAANQVVHGAFGAREMTFNCVLSVRNETVTVIGLTALGVRAFTVRYDGNQVEVENELPVPSQLTPERLLADIQLVFWPYTALQSVLEKAGWQITEPFLHTRRLRRGDQLIAEVHYDGGDPWRGRSWLVNLEHHYTLGIDSSVLGAP
jgi:hypothetical protein